MPNGRERKRSSEKHFRVTRALKVLIHKPWARSGKPSLRKRVKGHGISRNSQKLRGMRNPVVEHLSQAKPVNEIKRQKAKEYRRQNDSLFLEKSDQAPGDCKEKD